MDVLISAAQLKNLGLTDEAAGLLADEIKAQLNIAITAQEAWQNLSQNLFFFNYPFEIHLFVFTLLFPNWRDQPHLAPAYIPSAETIATANITQFMAVLGIADVKTFHRYTMVNACDFWQRIVDRLRIAFKKKYDQVCDLTFGIEKPLWLKGAKLNIADSCFNAPPHATAIIYRDQNKKICRQSYQDLALLSNRIANSLVENGYQPGTHIGLIMPMNALAVAIYLGIIKMGGVVVSIPDSFSQDEIAVRLNITQTNTVFIQNSAEWSGKKYLLYNKLKALPSVKAIVVGDVGEDFLIRDNDYAWSTFLVDNDEFNTVACNPDDALHVLFSSGTTAEPKAIAWTHLTPIKCASDAFFHQNIQANDVLAWPTNLGWMMGPWLIFAALINQASMALYTDAPKDRSFGTFVQDAGVTMLGTVPTLVRTWRHHKCLEGLDLRCIKTFSSSGECSQPEDMLYLMSLANYKPVIEYCGGTEIGGAYVSSTVVENNYPALFSTPVMGIDFIILDQHGQPSDVGEVAIVPPSIGLSTMILNADHHQIYFAGMPQIEGKALRRHGDEMKRLPNHYYMVLGRTDDSMNLGGIKVSAAEIERCLASMQGIEEIAAVAINPPAGGPARLIIFVILKHPIEKAILHQALQKRITDQLNPFFKIHEVICLDMLPKTASNKIMRRELRKQYLALNKW